MQECTTSIRVLYGDVDAMGVVHHANYLRFFEAARTEYLRARGRTYAEVEAAGVMLPVVDVQVRYLSPARYDDLLAVSARITELKRVSVAFTYEVRRMGEDTVLTRGRTILAVCDRTGRLRPMPPELRTLLVGPPAG